MIRIAALALMLALASCANPAAVARHEAYMNGFIGDSELALVRQWGVPSRSFDAGGHRFLAYDSGYDDLVPGMPFIGYGPYGFYDLGGGLPPHVVRWRCETTFELTDGRVIGWKQRGNYC